MDFHEAYIVAGVEPIYVDFMNEQFPSYEEVKNYEEMRVYMNEKLVKYND